MFLISKIQKNYFFFLFPKSGYIKRKIKVIFGNGFLFLFSKTGFENRNKKPLPNMTLVFLLIYTLLYERMGGN